MEMAGFKPTTPCFTRQITKYLIKLHYLFIVTEAGVEPTPIVVRLSLFHNLRALRLPSKLPCDDSSFAGIRTSTIRIKILCATFTLRRSNNFQGRTRTFNSPQTSCSCSPNWHTRKISIYTMSCKLYLHNANLLSNACNHSI